MAIPVRANNGGGNYKYPQRQKGPFIGIIFIIFALFISGIPMKLYNDYTVYRHEKIKNYLDQREQYFSSSDLEFKQLLNKMNQLKSTNISTLTLDIQQAKVVTNNNSIRVNELKPPRAFKDLHEETIRWFILKNSAIDYLETAAQGNSYNHNVLQNYINNINESVSNIQPKLIQGLQKEKLKYKINADGAITYWIKTDEEIE